MNKNEFFSTFKSPKGDENKVKSLIYRYGGETTLNDVLNKITSGYKPYECPKCHGNGYVMKVYNAYPSGFPDSGFYYEPRYDYAVCDLCDGLGRCDERHEPITKIVGWK